MEEEEKGGMRREKEGARRQWSSRKGHLQRRRMSPIEIGLTVVKSRTTSRPRDFSRALDFGRV